MSELVFMAKITFYILLAVAATSTMVDLGAIKTELRIMNAWAERIARREK